MANSSSVLVARRFSPVKPMHHRFKMFTRRRKPALPISFAFIALFVFVISRRIAKPRAPPQLQPFDLEHRDVRLPAVHLIADDNSALLRQEAASDSAPEPNFVPDAVPTDVSLRFVVLAVTNDDEAAATQTVRQLRTDYPSADVRLVHFAARDDPRLDGAATHYRRVSSRRPYDDPVLTFAHDAADVSTPTVFLRVGVSLAPRAVAWLLAARRAYATHPEVAAFALDAVRPRDRVNQSAPDHRPDAWAQVRLPNVSAFALRSSPLMSVFMLNERTNLQVADTFSMWLSLRRSDWYRYPTGEGVDGTPLGLSALPESNWTRAPWTVWFAKFLHEYQLSVVYPIVDGAMFSNSTATGSLHNGQEAFNMPVELPMYMGDGKLVPKGYFVPETVKKIVDLGKKQGDMVSFTMVNKIFIDTAQSWLCNVNLGGFRPRGLLWAVTDRESHEALSQLENSTTIWLNEIQGGKETGHEFGNPGYWKLMLERTALITEILKNGIAVFAFETDAVWLRDPSADIENLVQQDADIVGTINTRQEVSGNFFYLRPTLATRRLWHEITSEFAKAYKNAKFEKKAATSWTYIENDQSLLTKLVLRNETWRKAYPLTFLTLDMEKFVDGRWYKPEEGFYTSERARSPVVINNNFVIGVKEKTERAKKFGHWFWDERNKNCLQDVADKTLRKAMVAS